MPAAGTLKGWQGREKGEASSRDGPARPCFAEVVNEHWGSVYRLLHSLTGNRHATEDLVQETFLRALKRLDSFEPGTHLRAWLLRIASNAFLDEARRRKRASPAPLDRDLPGRAEPPGHALETAEQAARVREALSCLSDLTRLVFHLRAEEELPFREIARLAGTTEQAARWHMHQARTKLLERLGDRP
jgi:RNA polymerase sigma-70 factor (ECF subfamily)